MSRPNATTENDLSIDDTIGLLFSTDYISADEVLFARAFFKRKNWDPSNLRKLFKVYSELWENKQSQPQYYKYQKKY